MGLVNANETCAFLLEQVLVKFDTFMFLPITVPSHNSVSYRQWKLISPLYHECINTRP